MNTKFNIGQIIKRDDVITGITIGNSGVKYQTKSGAYTEAELDKFIVLPANEPTCAIQPITPQEDKPKYKSGDKAKLTRNSHPFYKDEIVEIYEHNGQSNYRCRSIRVNRDYGNWVYEDYLEPYAEPEQPKEPIVLYCIKDNCSDFTKGKTYVFDGQMHYNSFVGCHYPTFEDWKKSNWGYTDCLIKTEKRPAKLGEYVLITNDGVWMGRRYKTGEVYQINHINSFNANKCYFNFCKSDELFFKDSEYFVLPDYQPEKVEPTYLNMKVVCTDNGTCGISLIVGRAYAVIDGKFTDELERIIPHFETPFTTIEDMNAKCAKHSGAQFIKFEGEQSC